MLSSLYVRRTISVHETHTACELNSLQATTFYFYVFVCVFMGGICVMCGSSVFSFGGGHHLSHILEKRPQQITPI